ncbi:hypothetical protein ACQPZQ_19190 [Pseudonocardia sp. CA-142604]|uniref:hypothetical protein n=1 Tax=Pseudonocardia sp. CA-142604 TaxID=3240024 RepID=UPI003D93FA76
MDITRSTVPGGGTVHHVHTRGGRLHIVIEPDEADELAEVLQSGPMSDRLAEVERRLADLTGPGGRRTRARHARGQPRQGGGM